MPDLTLIGGGPIARACSDILSRAGFQLRHAFDLDSHERCPVILGDIPGAFDTARQAVDSGRPVLITNPAALPVERLPLLLESRRRNQAVFIWSSRRYHPGYHFVRGLIEADATWRPRFLRHESLYTEPATTGLLRWYALESAALIQALTGAAPARATAQATVNPLRNTIDYLSLSVSNSKLDAFIGVGLGEIVDRRETLIVAADRKALVDELNLNVPVRIQDDESARSRSNAPRWASYGAPSGEELLRQQCLSFLDATAQASLAQEEAELWTRAFTILDALDRSLQTGEVAVPVTAKAAQPRFRPSPAPPFSPSPNPAA